MKITAGLWIDHRKAVSVIISAAGERMMEIKSKAEKQPGRIDGVRSTAPYEVWAIGQGRQLPGRCVSLFSLWHLCQPYQI